MAVSVAVPWRLTFKTMKTRYTNSTSRNWPNARPKTRFQCMRDFVPQMRRLPVGRNTARAIVLNLSTTFPACAWAFVKMM
jgi:hypothetical protein